MFLILLFTIYVECNLHRQSIEMTQSNTNPILIRDKPITEPTLVLVSADLQSQYFNQSICFSR